MKIRLIIIALAIALGSTGASAQIISSISHKKTVISQPKGEKKYYFTAGLELGAGEDRWRDIYFTPGVSFSGSYKISESNFFVGGKVLGGVLCTDDKAGFGAIGPMVSFLKDSNLFNNSLETSLAICVGAYDGEFAVAPDITASYWVKNISLGLTYRLFIREVHGYYYDGTKGLSNIMLRIGLRF